jgi:hypothetical protein
MGGKDKEKEKEKDKGKDKDKEKDKGKDKDKGKEKDKKDDKKDKKDKKDDKSKDKEKEKDKDKGKDKDKEKEKDKDKDKAKSDGKKGDVKKRGKPKKEDKEEKKKKIKEKKVKKPPVLPATAGLEEMLKQCSLKMKELKAGAKNEEDQKFADWEFPVWDEGGQACMYISSAGDVGDNFGFEKVGKRIASWARLTEVYEKPKLFVDGCAPGDIIQGALGTCYLLGALASVATVDGLLKKLFIEYDEKLGIYAIRFFKNCEWIYVIVDDYVALNRNGTMLFAHCQDDETWVPLMEKAYAKLHGSFESVVGGYEQNALEDLTGGVGKKWWIADEKPEFLWSQLLLCSEGRLMMCSLSASGSGEVDGNQGILANHAYSVLRAIELEGIRLVQIRNPWGQHEWTGRWSDNSPEWKKYKDFKKKLNQKAEEDGSFWMCYEDFLSNWQSLSVCFVFNDEWRMTNLEFYPPATFLLTVKEPTQAVIAICQPDKRLIDCMDNYDIAIGLAVLTEDELKTKSKTLKYAPGWGAPLDAMRSACIEVYLQPNVRYHLFPMIEGEETNLYLRLFSHVHEVEVVDLSVTE